MLVFTVRKGERFFIGDNAVVEIVESSDGRVRVGVTAPRTVKVLREDLLSVPEAAAITHAAKGGR